MVEETITEEQRASAIKILSDMSRLYEQTLKTERWKNGEPTTDELTFVKNYNYQFRKLLPHLNSFFDEVFPK